MSRLSLPDRVPAPGEVLAGKYAVEGVIGEGGMGVVLRARHLELEELVAIKLLSGDGGDDPELVARFKREAWAASKIKNEHVVRVLDVSTLDDGRPFLVMEHLQGWDLEAASRRSRLTLEQAVDYLLQAAEALAEAHRAGIVHRDLKPGNLFLIHRADGSPWIKVLDFGISKIQSGAKLTATSALMGSPLYMAPEQLESSKHVDARTDIWALGVILFELATGRLPFSGETVPQICVSVLQAQLPRLQDVAPHLPASLEPVLVRCLTKDPAQRYQTLAELAQALAPFGSPACAGSVRFITAVLGGGRAGVVPGGFTDHTTDSGMRALAAVGAGNDTSRSNPGMAAIAGGAGVVPPGFAAMGAPPAGATPLGASRSLGATTPMGGVGLSPGVSSAAGAPRPLLVGADTAAPVTARRPRRGGSSFYLGIVGGCVLGGIAIGGALWALAPADPAEGDETTVGAEGVRVGPDGVDSEGDDALSDEAPSDAPSAEVEAPPAAPAPPTSSSAGPASSASASSPDASATAPSGAPSVTSTKDPKPHNVGPGGTTARPPPKPSPKPPTKPPPDNYYEKR